MNCTIINSQGRAVPGPDGVLLTESLPKPGTERFSPLSFFSADRIGSLSWRRLMHGGEPASDPEVEAARSPEDRI